MMSSAKPKNTDLNVLCQNLKGERRNQINSHPDKETALPYESLGRRKKEKIPGFGHKSKKKGKSKV